MPLRSIRRRILDHLVLQPSRDAIEHDPQQRVVLTSGGKPLECFVQRNHDGDAAELLVLKFPGTGGRAERSSPFPLDALPDIRTTLWTWNPPGYGGSGGRATLRGIADASVDFFHQAVEQTRPKRIWLCGNSLGGVTVLHLAATLSVDPKRLGLILRNPPPLIPVVKRIADRYPMGRLIHPVAESLFDSMNAPWAAAKVHSPAVFLQSECDTLVPMSLQQTVIDAHAGEKRVVIMKGLEHDGIPDRADESSIDRAVKWLWTRMD